MGRAWDASGRLELDNNASPAAGALAYFFEGGTTTPLAVYEDGGEDTPYTQPVEASAQGRWPLVIIPFVTSYDVQVTTAGGTQLYYHRELPNPDPVEAGTGTVTDSQLLQVGDVLWSVQVGQRDGFVRCNGRTIGSATSSATERAHADCEDLFTFLWNNDLSVGNTLFPVSTGKGGSAAADFAALKTITLPDIRGRSLIGTDDMGSSAASRLDAFTPFSLGDSVKGGSVCGENTHTLSEAELASHQHAAGTLAGASHTHTGTTDAGSAHSHTATDSGHVHSLPAASGNVNVTGAATFTTAAGVGGNTGTGTASITVANESAHTHSFTTNLSGTLTISGLTASAGSGIAHNVIHQSMVGTYYMKL